MIFTPNVLQTELYVYKYLLCIILVNCHKFQTVVSKIKLCHADKTFSRSAPSLTGLLYLAKLLILRTMI